MTTIRCIHNNNKPYLQINRKTLQRTDLSWEARGLWAYLLSLPSDWEINVKHLMTQSKASRDKVRKILNELKDAGLCWLQQRHKSQGKWGSCHYVIAESVEDLEEFKKSLPQTEKPGPAKPAPANPVVNIEDKTLDNKEYKIEKISKEIQKLPDTSQKSVAVAPSPQKISFGEFKRVKLSQEDYDDLAGRLGKSKLEEIIISVDAWLEENGKQKKNYKATILNWARREKNFNPKSQSEDAFKKHKLGAERLRDLIFSKAHPKDFTMFCGSTYVEVGYSTHPHKQILKYEEKNFQTLLEHHLRKMNILSLLESPKCLH